MYLQVRSPGSVAGVASVDLRRMAAFKQREPAIVCERDTVTVAGFGRIRAAGPAVAEGPDGAWAAAAGCWIHQSGIGSGDLDALLQRALQVGADRLATELDGVFALVIGWPGGQQVTIITDACGSLHLYAREDDTGIAIGTSSAGLSATGRLHPGALHEFVATGIIYEDRSLWEGVRKLPPGSLIDIDTGSMTMRVRRHWDIGSLRTESLGLDEAVEGLHGALRGALVAIGRSYPLVAADLTGGYDSRLLLAGLLASGIAFQSTVSGPPDSPDVRVARGLASLLGRTVRHSAPVPGTPHADRFDMALRLGDGECDAFDTARILNTHLPASEEYDASLNGSFGELARGYWWELLWPRLGAAVPLDTAMVARKRFAAAPYDPSVFTGAAAFSLVEHMSQVASRATADLGHLPNTSQMDALYYRLRMQRWQGRIASTTNQIWPAISPLAFRDVLRPILQAKASTRFRSLLPRALFARMHPVLASYPLEHGYPPRPLTLSVLPQFTPVLTHYGEKVWSRLSSRIGLRSEGPPDLTARQRYPGLFEALPMKDMLESPVLGATGCLNPDRLVACLNPDVPLGGGRLDQWNRMVTLEWALRVWEASNARAAR